MKKVMLRISSLLLGLIAILSSPAVFTSQEADDYNANIGNVLKYLERFENVYNYAFPVNHGSPIKTVYSIAIRYLPSFNPPSQIVFRFATDSLVYVDYMEAGVSLENLIMSGETDALKLAKAMNVETTSYQMTSIECMPYSKEFWSALKDSSAYYKNEALSNTPRLDPTKYVLEYRGRNTSISINTFGSDLLEGPSSKDSSLVKWMIAVHRREDHKIKNVRKR